jgi:hypothetical protein
MLPAVRLGVNYTPSEGWFHHWLDFDLDSVRADLDSIAALGLDHIRVFPLWPYFQPNRTLIRPRAVEQLVALADAAAGRSVCAPGGPVFEAFARLTADGARPTTVLASRAEDRRHLAARGITEVVTPDQVIE